MPELRPVTDPDILRQLNGGSDIPVPSPSGMKPVTDPVILAQLNSQQPQQKPTLWDKLQTTWPARMAKDIYSGAQLPGDVYAGKTQVDPSNPEFMHRVTTLGGVAPVGILPSVTAAAPSVKQLVETGGRQIREATESGLIFNPADLQKGIDEIRKSLPNRRVAEDTHAAIDALEGKVQSGQPMTFNDIKQARDELLDVQFNSAKSTSRTAAKDLQAATSAKHGLDDVIKATGSPEAEQFIAGNANVSGGKLGEGLDKRLYRSELRAAAANSGKNLGNTIKSNVASMLLSRDARTMPPAAREQAESMVYGSRPENLMRHWSNVLGGGGGLGQALTSAMTGGVGYLASGGSPTVAGMAAIGAPVIGSLLKHGANEVAVSNLEALSNALRANTPLGKVQNRGNYFAGIPESVTASKAALIRALMQQYPGGQVPQQ